MVKEPRGQPPPLDETAPWWTLDLEAAARREALVALPPGLSVHFPFLAWLTDALGPVRLKDTSRASRLAEALAAAGLVKHASGIPLALCDANEALDCATLSETVRLPVGAGRDVIVFPDGVGLVFSAPVNALGGPVGALLSAARDPLAARQIAALFAVLGERHALLQTLREVTQSKEALRHELMRTEARVATETARRRAIEQSATWLAASRAATLLEHHPRIARFARLAWHRVIRPVLWRRADGASRPALSRNEVTLCIQSVGTMVFTPAPASHVAAAALTGLPGRVEAAGRPQPAPLLRIGRKGLCLFFPRVADLPREAALALTLSDGTVIERLLPPRLMLQPRDAMRAILTRFDPAAENASDLLRAQMLPAVEACWAEIRRAPVTVEEITFGVPPSSPTVSVVVPLYGRMDWISIQAAHFADDAPLLSIAEFIYVLDDPAKVAEGLRLAALAHRSYGVPLRVLKLSRNCGYSAATNHGAHAARGEFLLMLNSDVVPLSPGWVERLVATFRSIPRCGVLGCRLLFDEGTLQHAGIAFRPMPSFAAWICDHPGKGEAQRTDDESEPRIVHAVTGACMITKRTLFAEVGGLCEEYVIGDFEDVDFCHRIAEAGRDIWYEPRVALTHFERQSFVSIGTAEWRYALTLCNMLLHARRWGPRLQRIAPLVDLSVA